MRRFLSLVVLSLATVCFGQSESGDAKSTVNTAVPASAPSMSTSLSESSGPCLIPLTATANELEQQQEDLNRKITDFESRARSVNTALLGMNVIAQNIRSVNVTIGQYQTAATDSLRSLKGDTFSGKDLSPAIRDLVASYSSTIERLTELPGLSGSTMVDPEVSIIITRYSRAVQDILDKRVGRLSTVYDQSSSVTRAELAKKVGELSDASFKEDISSISQVLTNSIGELNTLQKAVNANADAVRSCRTQVIEKRGEETFMNRLAIRYGLPWFCLTAMALFLLPQIIRAAVLVYKPELSAQLGFSVDKIIELVTILFISLTILILGLASKIDGQVLGTLLGGISGYVLNRISRQEGAQSMTAKVLPASPPEVPPASPPPAPPVHETVNPPL
jgi:hypothetical protein